MTLWARPTRTAGRVASARTSWTGSPVARGAVLAGRLHDESREPSRHLRAPATIGRGNRAWTSELVSMHRSRAIIRLTPRPGLRTPAVVLHHGAHHASSAIPTNWGLPRAAVTESPCAATGRAGLRVGHPLEESAVRHPGLGPGRGRRRPSAASLRLRRRWAALAVRRRWPPRRGAPGRPAARPGRERQQPSAHRAPADIQGEEIVYSSPASSRRSSATWTPRSSSCRC